ncbi:MAG: glycosyltransferase family 1 protein [Gammaproteobacteria bacterium SHHR-1]|uniref:glycosyltransferase family 4 protein n=1 Tax=Magnetovirga frankeli TaxID=947516 RepID=UPI00129315CB|nr:glycosyltransferase family 1 protein [gamma proteobacterium SS-5]
MRIAIITDAWKPQINGVVTTLGKMGEELGLQGHEVRFFTPNDYRSIPCPSYPEIPLALFPGRQLARQLDAFAPERLHIATEGPLGLAARRYALRRGLSFTSAYHTRFPEYLRLRAPVPLAVSYAFIRWFHGPAVRTLVPTHSITEGLAERGLKHLVVWSRGVDTQRFYPCGKQALGDLPRPVSLYAGRVAVEKNLEAFLRLDLPGTQVVVGDGPDLAMLKAKYPQALFTGYRTGHDLVQAISAADVFVFPSLTDTFGLVLLEAMACGVPVAAFPAPGPRDVVRNGENGHVSEDLKQAIEQAQGLDPERCRRIALDYSWRRCAEQFLGYLTPTQGPASAEQNTPGQQATASSAQDA